MDPIPTVLYGDREFTTWLIVGASRGIGLEFVRQLLARGERVIATVRQPYANHATLLWGEAGGDHGRCQMLICDILSEKSIEVSAVDRGGCEMAATDLVLHLSNASTNLYSFQI